MKIFNNKRVLLIICGGIAAYKSLELIRLFKKKGAQVKVVLTNSAQKFVTPLSATSLSQEKVYTDLFDINTEAEMDHIALSRWSDFIIVAPATANIIAKISNGYADNLASTVLLAADKQAYIVPAMNVRMWEHPSNKLNLKKIINIGYEIIGPDIGDMACGEYGEGKMTEPAQIVATIEKIFTSKNKNKNFRALVTAGPTREFIDPVRYITNRSSGKQGYEIAKYLCKNGFKTTLITGPTKLENIKDVNILKVETAKEMYDATIENLPVDIAVFTAAVSDFKLKNSSNVKIKNTEMKDLKLEKNIDILKHVSNHNSLRPKLVIGFAAETNNINQNSKKKLVEKNCDWLITNDVSNPEIGFDSDYNQVSIFYKDEKIEKLNKMKKSLVANEIVKRVISNING